MYHVSQIKKNREGTTKEWQHRKGGIIKETDFKLQGNETYNFITRHLKT